MGKKYNIAFSPKFYKDLETIVSYINDELKNNKAANNLLNKVERQINYTLKNPFVYKKRITKAGNSYYRININNYAIIYTIEDDLMIVRRIVYSKRNLENLF